MRAAFYLPPFSQRMRCARRRQRGMTGVRSGRHGRAVGADSEDGSEGGWRAECSSVLV